MFQLSYVADIILNDGRQKKWEIEDGQFTSAGIIGVPPKELSYDQLKTILNRLSLWNNTGVFRQKIQDYIAFTKVSGDVV